MITTTPKIKLTWYEEIHVRMYRKFSPDFPRNRIVSIDWFKGYAIMWIMIAHLMSTWADKWAWRLIYLPQEFLGPTTFLLFAGINSTFSFRIGQAYGLSQKNLYIDTIRRMLGMLVISIIVNIVLGAFYADHIDLLNLQTYFRWDVLQTIAFSVVLTLPALKFSVKTRFVMALGIIFTSVPVFLYLNSVQSESIVAWILIQIFFFPFTQSPLFPLIAFALIGGIVIDLLLPYLQLRPEFNKLQTLITSSRNCGPQIQLQRNARFISPPLWGLKIIVGVATCAMVGGILSGLQPPTQIFYQEEVQTILGNFYTNPELISQITFIPAFLITYTFPNIFFKLGIVVLMFSAVFYFFDVKHADRKTHSKLTKQMAFMGEYTFSYFVYVAIFNLFPFHFDIFVIWIPMFLAMAILTKIFKLVLKYTWGVAMMEWCMNLFTLKLTIPATTEDIKLAYPEKIRRYENEITVKSK
jgi:hypothetical protein